MSNKEILDFHEKLKHGLEIAEQRNGQFIVGGFFFLFNRYLQTAEVIG